MTTLEQLRRRYPANYIPVEQLLTDHLPHIGSVSHLRRKVREGQLDIRIQQIDPSSKRSPWVIYLHNLADWLDRQAAAADDAA
ncbi:Pyocin activator protein PrtN [compost metagenome]